MNTQLEENALTVPEDKKSRWSRGKENFAQNATRRSECVSGYEIRILAMPEANGLLKWLFIKDSVVHIRRLVLLKCNRKGEWFADLRFPPRLSRDQVRRRG